MNIAIDACILWKSRANPGKYRIAKYSRYIFEKSDNVAIDFGDYSSFLLITGKNACEAVHNALYRKT